MPTSVPTPRSRFAAVTSIGRRRFAALAAGTITMVGTGAVASQGARPSPSPASTRLHHRRIVSYPAEQVWPTALRYLRVDRAYALVDRDREAGYILFDFPLDGRPDASLGRGSLELVATTDPSGRSAVQLQVSTDAGPAHLPNAIAEGLVAKLKNERGQPAPPPRPEPEPPKPDPGPWVPEPEQP